MKLCIVSELTVFISFILIHFVTGVTFSNGAYSNLVIAIADDVPVKECPKIIYNLEAALTSASGFLYTATLNRAYFDTIYIVAPNNWSGIQNCQGIASSQLNWEQADIRIGQTHPVFGDTLWTQQSEGCGIQGDFISMSYVPLLNQSSSLSTYGNLGYALLKEWSKYRYGVFDEFGFLGDSVYPPSYKNTNNELQPNLCTDGSTWSCSSSEGCLSQQHSSDGHCTSILGMPYISSVSGFCNATKHISNIPTKQNALCNQRNTLDVVLNGSDFQSLTVPVTVPSNRPLITVVSPPRVQYMVLLIESSPSISGTKNAFWNCLSEALNDLVSSIIPDSTLVGVIQFNSVYKTIINMTMVSANRTEITTAVYTNFIAADTGTSPINLNNAVEGAIDMLKTSTAPVLAGSSIIIVSSGNVTSADVTNTINTINNANTISGKINIAVIEYPNQLGFIQQLPAVVDGTYNAIPTTCTTDLCQCTQMTLMDLEDTFIGVVDDVTPSQLGGITTIVYEKAVNVSDATTAVESGSFVIDDDSFASGSKTRMVYCIDAIISTTVSMDLTSPTGIVYKPSMIRRLLVPSCFLNTFSFNQTGLWTYNISAPTSGSVDTTTFVQVTSKSIGGTGGGLTYRFFTSGNSQQAYDATTKPIALYVEIKQFNMPVLNVDVIVSITYPSSPNITDEALVLLDDGSGDPDITGGDGVYSRYLTNYGSTGGNFKMSVSITARSNSSYTIKHNGTGVYSTVPVYCCGSVVNIPSELQVPIAFQRHIQGSTVQISAVNSNPDTYPPGKVGNFQESNVTGSSITFEWTATGGNYDIGAVSAYTIKYSTTNSDLLTYFNNSNVLVDITSANFNIPGATLYATVTMNKTGLYYYAIAARDSLGNYGPPSNIISIYIPGNTDNAISNTDLALIITFSIIGGLLLIALIILLIYCCCCRREDEDDDFQTVRMAPSTSESKIEVIGLPNNGANIRNTDDVLVGLSNVSSKQSSKQNSINQSSKQNSFRENQNDDDVSEPRYQDPRIYEVKNPSFHSEDKRSIVLEENATYEPNVSQRDQPDPTPRGFSYTPDVPFADVPPPGRLGTLV